MSYFVNGQNEQGITNLLVYIKRIYIVNVDLFLFIQILRFIIIYALCVL